MFPWRPATLLFALLTTPLLAATAHAHPAGFGLLTAEVSEGGEVELVLRVSGSPDRALAIELVPPTGCEARAPTTTRARRAAIDRRWHLRCPTPLRGELGLRNLPVDLQVRLELREVDHEPKGAILHAGRPTHPLAGASTNDAFARYLVLGIEHIAFGLDHLLFVLALVLLVRRWRRLVVTITAFTLGHSLTLGLASVGWVNVAIAPVEACIALSILVLAHELTRAKGEGPRGATAGDDDADEAIPLDAGATKDEHRAEVNAAPTTLTRRYPGVIAGLFGLLHGLGFAGALADVGLPQDALVPALFAFNLGVELGQLAFVGIGVVGLAALRHRVTLDRHVTRALAYGLGALAAFWTLDRTLAVLLGT